MQSKFAWMMICLGLWMSGLMGAWAPAIPIAAAAVGAREDAILGTYWTDDRTGRIEIFRQGPKYFGKIVWEEPRDDGRDFVGIVFIRDFVFDGEAHWIDGEVIDPEDGGVHQAKMWLEGTALKLRGYVGIALFGQTVTFVRATME